MENEKRKVDDIKTLFTDKCITLRRIITEDKNKDQYIIDLTNPDGSKEEYLFLVVTSNIISEKEGIYKPILINWNIEGKIFLKQEKMKKCCEECDERDGDFCEYYNDFIDNIIVEKCVFYKKED